MRRNGTRSALEATHNALYKSTVTTTTTTDRCQPLYNYEVERLLSKLRLTAAGSDGIPAWLLRSSSFEIADIVTHIFNCSVSTGAVPSRWLNALVSPVPKVHKPNQFSDYCGCPISITPHLSRITEKIIVQQWLQPAIPAENILDQYTYKPTGSTTTALVYLFYAPGYKDARAKELR